MVPVMTDKDFEMLNEFINNYHLIDFSAIEIATDEAYDQKVQHVLDEYWPGTTDLTLMKGGDDVVYSAMYNGEKVIVKSTPYDENDYATNLLYNDFLNFLKEEIDVAYYIEPGVEHSDDRELTITMSLFATGIAPRDLPPNQPLSWVVDEEAVKANGKFWG